MGSIRVSFLNDQIGVLMEEKNNYAPILEHRRSEHQKVLDYINGLFGQREELGVLSTPQEMNVAEEPFQHVGPTESLFGAVCCVCCSVVLSPIKDGLPQQGVVMGDFITQSCEQVGILFANFRVCVCLFLVFFCFFKRPFFHFFPPKSGGPFFVFACFGCFPSLCFSGCCLAAVLLSGCCQAAVCLSGCCLAAVLLLSAVWLLFCCLAAVLLLSGSCFAAVFLSVCCFAVWLLSGCCLPVWLLSGCCFTVWLLFSCLAAVLVSGCCFPVWVMFSCLSDRCLAAFLLSGSCFGVWLLSGCCFAVWLLSGGRLASKIGPLRVGRKSNFTNSKTLVGRCRDRL